MSNLTKEQFAAKFTSTIRSMYSCVYSDGNIPEDKFQEYLEYEYARHCKHYEKVEKALSKAYDYAERTGRSYVDETTFNTFFNEV